VHEASVVAVLVHGRNQDETVMLDVVDRLGELDLPVAYVMPVAAGGSWYDGRYFDPIAELEPQVGWAMATIERTLADIGASGVADEKVVIGGFSQGACLVATMVAHTARAFKGVAVLTGSLIGSPDQREIGADLTGLPMYLASSRYDDWVPLPDAQATANAFREAGASARFEVLEEREHVITDAAVTGLRSLLCD
jgi:phospholipase/carboxylesterase